MLPLLSNAASDAAVHGILFISVSLASLMNRSILKQVRKGCMWLFLLCCKVAGTISL